MKLKYLPPYDQKLTKKLVSEFIKANGFKEVDRIFFEAKASDRTPAKSWVFYTHPKLKKLADKSFSTELALLETEVNAKLPLTIGLAFRSKKHPTEAHLSFFFQKDMLIKDKLFGDLHNHFSELFDRLADAVELMTAMDQIPLTQKLIDQIMIKCIQERLIAPLISEESEKLIDLNKVNYDAVITDEKGVKLSANDSLFDLNIMINKNIINSEKKNLEYKYGNKLLASGERIQRFMRYTRYRMAVSEIFENYVMSKFS